MKQTYIVTYSFEVYGEMEVVADSGEEARAIADKRLDLQGPAMLAEVAREGNLGDGEPLITSVELAEEDE